jgi:hypothetical protein
VAAASVLATACAAPVTVRTAPPPPMTSPAVSSPAPVVSPASPAAVVSPASPAAVSSPAPDSRTRASSPASALAFDLNEPHCSLASLRAVAGDPVSPETGEHPGTIDIVNTGPAPCWLMGYPRLRIDDAAGRALAFTYTDGGGYVTPNPPAEVSIAPGAQAVVVFAKYRCDGPNHDIGTSVEVSLPGIARTIAVEGFGEPPLLDYCGPNDPGDLVYVSPVEPDIASAVADP